MSAPATGGDAPPVSRETGPVPAPRSGARRGRSRPVAVAAVLVAAVLLGLAAIAMGAVARPLQGTCDPALATDVCLETIDAGLRRGLPRLHPLILTAHAEPGPAAGPDEYGHRATVTYALLGVPGPTTVRLFFDAGAHWGGIPSRGDVELAAWAAAQGVVVAGAVVGAWLLLRRRGPRAPTKPPIP